MVEGISIRFSAGLLGRPPDFVEDPVISIRDGIVESVGKGCEADLDLRGYLVMPPLANMHVHVLDCSFAEAGLEYCLDDVVGEPHGIKYVMLKKVGRVKLAKVLENFIKYSLSIGVGFISEFRELGLYGLMLDAGRRLPTHYALAMPTQHDSGALDELRESIGVAEGLAISSPLYFSRSILSEAVSMFKNAGKVVMAHISETEYVRGEGDFEAVMNLPVLPDAIVHGTWLGRAELELLASKDVKLVLCVRSNEWFDVGLPKLRDVYESRVSVSLGTDNCGWVKPDLWREGERLLTLLRRAGITDPRWVLSAMINSSPIGVENSIECGRPANLLVIRYGGTELEHAINKYAAIVKRGEGELVDCLILEGRPAYCEGKASALRNSVRNHVGRR